MRSQTNRTGICLAIGAAALYATATPCEKLLLAALPPTLMAGFLYLGAGVAMGFLQLLRRGRICREDRLRRADLPDTLAMILLDIAAPVLLLLGLRTTPAASASLLNNFEIAATALFALAVFGEKISLRLWLGIGFVTASCLLLTLEPGTGLQFSPGSLLIVLACLCWGVENNCTRRLSGRDPLQIVLCKGIFSGTGALVIGLLAGQRVTDWTAALVAMAVGMVAYGMSIFCYVHAQRRLGAARTSAYYAAAPFLAAGLSVVLCRQPLGPTYLPALALMLVGGWLSASDRPLWQKCRRPWRRDRARQRASGQRGAET